MLLFRLHCASRWSKRCTAGGGETPCGMPLPRAARSASSPPPTPATATGEPCTGKASPSAVA
eukprot:376768-Amphidinium_carterae.4